MNYSLFSDEELVALLKRDDQEAFRTLYERYWKEVFSIANRKLSDRAAAEEVTQDLFLSLWQKRNEVVIQYFRGWILGAVRFSVINRYKIQMVHEKFVGYAKQNAVSLGNETDQPANQNELSEAIQKGIALLPEKTQQVFKLSRFENCTVKEISNVLNISEKAVEYHITQSLKQLRFHLRDFLTSALFICLACIDQLNRG